MRRLLPLLLLLASADRCAGLALSHWDLEGANGTCDGRASCAGSSAGGGGGGGGGAGGGWRERNCQCDAACARFGDCCLDSAHFAAAEQRRAAASFACVPLRRFGGVYMVAHCPPQWADADARRRCELTEDAQGRPFGQGSPPDPLAAMPVTSPATNLTYRSAACAACHGDLNAGARLWLPRVECPAVRWPPGAGPVGAAAHALAWDPARRQWGLALPRLASADINCSQAHGNGTCAPASAGVWRACAVDPVPPPGLAPAARRCEPALVRSCAADWARADVRARCDAYTALVYEGVTAYRNPHCAMCNRVPLQYLSCSKTLQRSLFHTEFSPGAFALLLDVRGAGLEVGRVSPCEPGALWDPFFKRCRRVLCPAGDFDGERCLAAAPAAPAESAESIEPGPPAAAHAPDDNELSASDAAGVAAPPPGPAPGAAPTHQGRVDAGDAVLGNASVAGEAGEAGALSLATCARWLLEEGEFEVAPGNATAWVPAYGALGQLPAGAFRLRPDGRLELCSEPFAQQFTPKFPAALGWVSLVALSLSCVCLLLHLLAFAVAPGLRSPAGCALASLAVALLLAYGAFSVGLLLAPGSSPCAAAAAVAYFGFLAAAAWSAAVALDVWRSLRMAARQLRVRGSGGTRRFLLCSLCAWALPATATALAVWADADASWLPDDLRPRFGQHVCWFGHRRALLLFFAAPLALATVLGAACFAASARVLGAATAVAAAGSAPGGLTGGGGPRRDFRLYLRLALVMGLAWAAGLAAAALDLPLLWYAFVLLCAMQGVFLLWAFTLTGRGRRALTAALPLGLRARLRKAPVLGPAGLGAGLGLGLGGAGGGGASFAWAGGRVASPPSPSSASSPSPHSLSNATASSSSKTQLTHCASLY